MLHKYEIELPDGRSLARLSTRPPHVVREWFIARWGEGVKFFELISNAYSTARVEIKKDGV